MRLRLATFNLENLDTSSRGVPLDERCRVLRPQLVALDADVLCLQEVSAHARHDGHRTLAALDQLLADTPYAGFARATTHAAGGGLADVHNLVVVSRWPIVGTQQHLHDLVAPPTVRLTTPPTPEEVAVRWDRPLLQVELAVPGSRPLVVWNAHLRAPLAAAIPGGKRAHQWLSTAAWAEGYLLAAIKRVGQALELRHHVDRRLDADPDAWIVVAGDLNAGADGAAYRLLRADVEDTGAPALAGRALVALEERVDAARRYTVRLRGRALLLDHLLATPALAQHLVAAAIDNAALEDEHDLEQAGRAPVGSLHAPLVAEFALPTSA
jgi:endonuclease/exonuclease/phosphatase family metal-dependent hydrolase